MIPDSKAGTIEQVHEPSPTGPSPKGLAAGVAPPRRHILGARIDDLDWEWALAQIEGYALAGRPHQLVTPNPELVMLARRNPAFRAVLEAADLSTCDGVGLRWAGRLLGQPLRAVIPGSELILRMAPQAAATGRRWFLLGGAPGVAEAVGQRLEREHPGLVIAGCHAGSPRPEDEAEILARIAGAAPVDALFVAYGSPAQELWIARNLERMKIPVAVGVGGAFNFVAGISRRPPEWVRRAGLIWLFRLITEPWRWRRQLKLLAFVGLVLIEALRSRRGLGLGLERHPPSRTSPPEGPEGDRG
jgi:N-acetylglucosaminyldiphosphoundecaprenol N-acetyl-beta-D-mannosaminyltransferase